MDFSKKKVLVWDTGGYTEKEEAKDGNHKGNRN